MHAQRSALRLSHGLKQNQEVPLNQSQGIPNQFNFSENELSLAVSFFFFFFSFPPILLTFQDFNDSSSYLALHEPLSRLFFQFLIDTPNSPHVSLSAQLPCGDMATLTTTTATTTSDPTPCNSPVTLSSLSLSQYALGMTSLLFGMRGV
jgi:hypothetical protein